MKAVSLFSGAGIGESRLQEIGVEVYVANELIDKRASLYRELNADSQMISGNIEDFSVFNEVLALCPQDLDLLIATPPCQGVSIAGKNRVAEQMTADTRNHLIFRIMDVIRATRPKHVLIENVPQYLSLQLPLGDQSLTIPELLQREFSDRYHLDSAILNAAQFGVPQSRKRAFIKMSRTGKAWNWPEPASDTLTVEDTIVDLPSLEAGEDSGIPWHSARKHSKEHVEWMRHTPTGKSAFDNAVYFPKHANGDRIRAYNTTYRRMEWNKPAPAITMRNDAISSQMNVHPGRKKKDGTYSDARVLTPRELLMINGMEPEIWNKICVPEILLRKVLGEGVPPLLLNAVISPLLVGK